MGFQDDPAVIRWRVHLRSPPHEVYGFLATDEGRASWAESAEESNGRIHFRFPNGVSFRGPIVERVLPHRFPRSTSAGRSPRSSSLDDGTGATDLTLTETEGASTERTEVIAGWVSVLLVLKAAADHDADLRNHDPRRTWDGGYAENLGGRLRLT